MIEQFPLLEEEHRMLKIFTGPDQAILWEIAQQVAAFPAGYFCQFCRSMGAHTATCIVIKARELVARESRVAK